MAIEGCNLEQIQNVSFLDTDVCKDACERAHDCVGFVWLPGRDACTLHGQAQCQTRLKQRRGMYTYRVQRSRPLDFGYVYHRAHLSFDRASQSAFDAQGAQGAQFTVRARHHDLDLRLQR